MEIVPWQSLLFYKGSEWIRRYPLTERVWNTVTADDFVEKMEHENMKNEVSYDVHSWFFSILKTLRKNIELPQMRQWRWSENVAYADVAFNAKNAYLSSLVCFDVENIFYSFNVCWWVKNVYNWVSILNTCDNVYMSMSVSASSNIFYSKYITNCFSLYFCVNMMWCSHCIGCWGLQNKQYCISNKQYDKETRHQYAQKILSDKNSFEWLYENLHSYQGANRWSTNVEWTYIINSSDVRSSQYVLNVSHGRNNCMVWSQKEYTLEYSYDNAFSGNNSSHIYGCHGVSPGEHIYCSMNSGWVVSHIFYCRFVIDCSFCLWCIWLKNKSYCIFNKQYTKEDRYDAVDKIFIQMEKDWQLWEFFPWSMNPFYFNDTAAYLIDPSFTKEEVTAKWYLRRDEPIKVDIPVEATLVSTADLDQYEWFDNEWNWIINADILKVVIQDEQDNYYRIIQMEYDFLVKHGLPLPRKHWLERMKDNFKTKVWELD